MSSDLADRIARLSPTQRALLEKRLLDAQASGATAPSRVRDPSAPIPLSSPQSRLWLIQQLDPNVILFNTPGAWHLQGALNLNALQQALDLIVARHAPLRSGMVMVNGVPSQIIRPPSPVVIERHNLCNIPPEEQLAQARQIQRALAHRPFDLTRDQFVRTALVELDADEHIMLSVRHHIAHDAWSVTIFNRELAEAYRAFTAGETPHLPALRAEYADFAYWQNERMQGLWFSQELEFWRDQLQTVPDLNLPLDRPRPPNLTYHGEQHNHRLDSELSAALYSASRREGVTLFMLMLAAFEILLGRYAMQDDFAVGTNILGRDRVEYENLIGYFANVLALRANLAGDPTFREFLHRVRQVVLDSFAHREVPFEKILWELRRPRDESRTPLFQVLFQTVEVDLRMRALGDVKVTPLFFDPQTSEYDILLDVRALSDGITCGFRYSTDLFDAPTIERLAHNYVNLLREVVAHPDASLSLLPVMTAAEREQILVTWNQTTADFPRSACIHHLFEIQVTKTPDAIAARFDRQTLTYRELNARANQLAHTLIKQGITPDTRVAICIERSLDMLIALLGVLKAGGAYLPLEPNTPPVRLQFILEQSGAAVLLTSTQVAGTLPPLSLKQILLDRIGESFAGESKETPSTLVTPSNLAYVIYTSGTTGQPKGVMVEHHSLVNHATFFARYYDLTQRDRVLQFAPIAFDFATEEIFPAWLSGAAVVIRPELAALAPREFFEFVAQHQLTVLDLPTAFWHTLVAGIQTLNLSLPPSVRLVIVGGEKASAQSLVNWRARVGAQVRWVNTYGPTEATIAVTTYEPQTLPAPDSDLLIGRPIANTQIFILDAHFQPVPIGVIGELYIGGEPVARGYLNEPNLTLEKFVRITDLQSPVSNLWSLVSPSLNHSISPSPSISHLSPFRLFKTGDLARFRADGQIEFIGRRDDQIKLRGFRVELGEIEAALAQHPQILQNAVMLRHDHAADPRLVAYVVASDSLDATALRSWLRPRLPEYMLPGAFVFLDSLPLTPIGKIDRRALPSLDAVALPTIEFIVPRTRVEQTIAAIWTDVLHVPRVGIGDDFFELGGHSLLATLAVARTEVALGQTITLRSLFDNPTLGQWAAVLEQNAYAPALAALPIVPLERSRYRRAVNIADK